MHQPQLSIVVLNVIVNLILSASVFHLFLKVFWNPESKIHDYKVAAFLCKFACSVTLCGTISNIITLSTPSWTEMLLNVGVSFNFLWLSFYDRITYTPNSNVSTKIPKRSSTKRNGPSKSSAQGSSSRRNGRKRPSSR